MTVGRAAGIILLSLLIVGLTFFRSPPLEQSAGQTAVPENTCQLFQAFPLDYAEATTGLPEAKPQQARLMAPSALVSDRSVPFYALPSRTAGPGTIALGYAAADHAFHPTALVVHHSAPGGLTQFVVPSQNCARVNTASHARLGIEHLYTFALTLDPLAQFALSVCGSDISCLAKKQRHLSHGELLSALAAWRVTHAQQRWQHEQGLARWVSVALTNPERDADDRVSIRLKSEPASFAGSSVAFSRRPHAGCIAPVDSTGLATCIIEDPHGDEHSEEEENGPIIATYSGKLLPGIQFLPATHVLPQRLLSSLKDESKP